IGSLLLLWPTLWALWFSAQGRPDLKTLVVFVVGVFLMRSAGCVINDYADREFDPHVERTRTRPIAAGRVPPREALVLFGVLCLVAFVLALTLNRLTILLAFAGAFLAATYPFLKRWTHLPQFYLGVAFGWGIPMAFAAQTDSLPTLALLAVAGFMADRGMLYHGGLVVAATFAVREQWLIRNRARDACFHAFLDNNRFGAAVFLGLVLDYLVMQ